MVSAIGADCGTFNLIVARRNQGKVSCKREVNAFLEMSLENRFMFNMMKKAGVPLIERDKVVYAVGEAAVNMAYTLNEIELKRPMKDGCLNPAEKDAFRILQVMIHSLIGKIDNDGDYLYYSVPANAINEETDADYHSQVLKSVFKSYNIEEKSLKAFPINEALAIVFAELGDKAYTGVGISFGGGMINVCYSIYSTPVFQFSIVNSGDWIDKMAARATGESTTFINKEKEKIDLTKEPTTMVERAIQTQYRLMIDKTMKGIRDGMIKAGNKAHTEQPVDVIVAGGTASPPGFLELVREAIEELGFPIEIANVRKPEDHLFTVSKGCLVAAENALE